MCDPSKPTSWCHDFYFLLKGWNCGRHRYNITLHSFLSMLLARLQILKILLGIFNSILQIWGIFRFHECWWVSPNQLLICRDSFSEEFTFLKFYIKFIFHAKFVALIVRDFHAYLGLVKNIRISSMNTTTNCPNILLEFDSLGPSRQVGVCQPNSRIWGKSSYCQSRLRYATQPIMLCFS